MHIKHVYLINCQIINCTHQYYCFTRSYIIPFDRRVNPSFTSSGLPSEYNNESYEGLRCILKAQLDATRTLMTEVKSVYTRIVDRSVLHQEEQEVEEEELLEYDSSDDSDIDSD